MNKAVAAACQRHGHDAAVLSPDGQTVSFVRLGDLINSFSIKLRAAGIGPGTCVAPVVDNSAIRIALTFAITRIGADVLLSGLVGSAQAANVAVTHAVCLPDQTSDLCENIIFDDSWLTLQTDTAPFIDESDLIAASSGTVGTPKYMPISTSAELARVHQYNTNLGKPKGRQFIGFGEGSAVGHRFILRAFLAGCGVMFRYKSSTDTLARMVEFGVREIYATPMLIEQFLDAHENGAPLPNIHKVTLGGSMVSLALVERVAMAFKCPIDVVAGASEVGAIAGGTVDLKTYETGWIGHVADGVEVQIRDDKAMWIRGNATLCGNYFNENGPFDADGWFSAGDLAHFTDNKELVIDGRQTDLINLGGQKLMPGLIEAVATQCVGVRQVAAVGIQTDAGYEEVGLVVVSSDDFQELILRAAIAGLLGEMARFHVRIVPALTYSAANKLDRKKMRDLFT